MPRYFFDFVDGEYTTDDADGHELSSPEVARDEVLKVLAEVYAHEPRDTDHRRVSCSVNDERDTIIYRASLTLEGVRSPNG